MQWNFPVQNSLGDEWKENCENEPVYRKKAKDKTSEFEDVELRLDKESDRAGRT